MKLVKVKGLCNCSELPRPSKLRCKFTSFSGGCWQGVVDEDIWFFAVWVKSLTLLSCLTVFDTVYSILYMNDTYKYICIGNIHANSVFKENNHLLSVAVWEYFGVISFRLLGIFWKCARIGERKSPYVAVCCIAMAISILFFTWRLEWITSQIRSDTMNSTG